MRLVPVTTPRERTGHSQEAREARRNRPKIQTPVGHNWAHQRGAPSIIRRRPRKCTRLKLAIAERLERVALSTRVRLLWGVGRPPANGASRSNDFIINCGWAPFFSGAERPRACICWYDADAWCPRHRGGSTSTPLAGARARNGRYGKIERRRKKGPKFKKREIHF